MKKLILALLLMIISIIIYPFTAMASPEVTNVVIQAEVPKDFEKNILINFTLEDKTNALYRLEKVNDFTTKGTIPIGKHKIDFINILDDVRGAYKVKAPEEIETKKGTITSFKIIVEHNKEKNNDNDIIKMEKVEEKNSENIQESKKIKNKKGFFRRYTVTLVMFLIACIGCLIIKAKKN